MKAKIADFETDISLTIQDVKDNCKMGHGHDTCVWLILGPKGFECSYYNRPLELIKRWANGLTGAKRDGCDKVKNFDPSGHSGEEIEF